MLGVDANVAAEPVDDRHIRSTVPSSAPQPLAVRGRATFQTILVVTLDFSLWDDAVGPSPEP
jgi:hypothetical protein